MTPSLAQTSTGSIPVALTIATSDSGAGAGIQADLLTFAATGCFGVTALAALTAQSPAGVSGICRLSASFLLQQLSQLFSFFDIRACKTGMLFSSDLISAAAETLRQHRVKTVVDPVMVATSGAVLLEPEALDTLLNELIPAATVFTPNLDEAAVLLARMDGDPVQGCLPEGRRIQCLEQQMKAAERLVEATGTAILLKGGHLPGNRLIDLLQLPGGQRHTWEAQRMDGVNTHGSGCTLSAAIASGLAQGLELPEATGFAHRYLQRAIQQASRVGNQSYINHFPKP